MQKEKRLNKAKVILIILCLFVFLGIRLYIDNNVFETSVYTVNLANNTQKDYATLKEKVIIQISDLHNKSYGPKNIDLINEIDKINPDYILLTGDMVSSEDTEFSGFYSLIDAIGPKYKCFYAVGNHELGLKKGLITGMYDYMLKKGVYVLDNNVVEIDGIDFYGLNYKFPYYKNKKYSLKEMNKDLRRSK